MQVSVLLYESCALGDAQRHYYIGTELVSSEVIQCFKFLIWLLKAWALYKMETPWKYLQLFKNVHQKCLQWYEFISKSDKVTTLRHPPIFLLLFAHSIMISVEFSYRKKFLFLFCITEWLPLGWSGCVLGGWSAPLWVDSHPWWWCILYVNLVYYIQKFLMFLICIFYGNFLCHNPNRK